MLNFAKGWRTIAFNALVAVFYLAVHFGFVTAEQVPDQVALNALLDQIDSAIIAIGTIGNAVLRVITNTPIGKKTPEVVVLDPSEE